MFKNYLFIITCFFTLGSCVTHTINSDGTIQNTAIDKTKLADTYVDLAVEYQKRGAPQVALERVNLAISTNQANARAYMIRGMINQSLNQTQSAEKDFKKALSIKSDYPEAYVNYAVFLCAQKQYLEANTNFEKALVNPLYSTPEIAYYSRGKCNYIARKWQAANADYLKALSYRNHPQETYVALARLQYEQKNYVLANYYINKFNNSQTAETLLLHIQILQSLIDEKPSPIKLREYTAYRNTLAKLLISNYGDSPEAQQYHLQGKNVNNVGAASFKDNPANSFNKNTNSAKIAEVALIPNYNNIFKDNNNRRYIIISPEDTLYSIARKYVITVKQLEAINDLHDGIAKRGSKIYLDPK